jgi:O-antigen/teichoic acid export membrane protein
MSRDPAVAIDASRDRTMSWQRFARYRNDDQSRELMRGSYSLLANTAVTGVLGMAFWIAATRLYSPVTVGRDNALIAVMVELSTLCQLNLGNGIVRFLPDLGPRTPYALGLAYVLTGALAIVVGAGFVALTPSLSHELLYLQHDHALAGVFVVALALWGVFVLQDAALTATRGAPWIPLENGLFGVLKLAALPLLLVVSSGHGVFLAWVVPMALLLVPVNILIFRRAIPRHASRGDRTTSLAQLGRRRAVRFLAQDYLASVFTQATMTVLPLVVIATLGARQSAYFAMPFTIAIAFDTFAYGACSALVVEATLEPAKVRALTRTFTRRILGLVWPAAAVLIVAAPVVMLPFGQAYADRGASVLRLLLCASLFRIVVALFSATSRIQARGLRLGLAEAALLLLVLGGAVVFAHTDGIEGVAVAWLAANALIAAMVGPLVLAALRTP